MSTDDDLTLAYFNGLHTGRKQEQERILKIAYDECLACGSVGGQSWLNIKSAVRNQPSEVKPDAVKPVKRAMVQPQARPAPMRARPQPAGIWSGLICNA